MSERFPHLDGNTSPFPDVSTVDVFKYDNSFDYSRYNYTQMKLTVCTVPWDMGEAHIGNRTIEGIGNVVAFESKAARDAWFAAIPANECFRFETKLKKLHRDNVIDVPIPFDVACKYNYVTVEYSLFANDNSPVQYENADGLRKWFWFIRECEFVSPNTTRIHLMIDAWQTFIYDIQIGGMMLERGHAPMFATTVDDYLENPIRSCSNLLAPDVNYGTTTISKAQSSFILNDANMVCLIISTANPFEVASWGSKANGNWNVHANGHFQTQGVPSLCAFALDPANLSQFLFNVDSTVPQFMQTIRAISFVAAKLVTLGNSVTFAGYPIYEVTATPVQNNLYSLSKADFGFGVLYEDIAKLYTYPYSYIEVTDELGNVSEIHIEDTNGSIKVESCVNLVFPWLNVTSQLTGIGRTARSGINFKNVTDRTFYAQGNWYRYVKEWSIPTFEVTQSPQTYNDYNTHFDRAQQATAYNNQYTSEIASANTAQTNANADADTAIANAALQQAANTANNSANNTYQLAITDADRYLNNQQASASNAYISTSTNNDVAAADAQAAIGAASAGVTAAASAVGSLASGNIAGAIGSAIGGAASVASTIASNNVAVNLKQSQAEVAKASNNTNAAQSNTNMNTKNAAWTANASALTLNANDLVDGTTDNSAATAKANASRSNATQSANAGRTLDTAQNAVANQIAQAGLADAQEFGQANNGDNATTRPMGLFANVVTQNDYAIGRAGDEFLRYGYMYNGQWLFDGNWNVGKYFTYWKLSDFWITGLNVPDAYVDRIRFFLFGGVTVWSNPADIGNVTIYDNMETIYDNMEV